MPAPSSTLLVPGLVLLPVLVPVVAGIVFCLLRVAAALLFCARGLRRATDADCPAVSVLKPVYGLEKDLEENLRSACTLDYPHYEVVFCVQRPDEPALPIVERLADEFGSDRVVVATTSGEPPANGKIFNLANGVKSARHDVLVISDSDVRLRPDYLRTVVEPLRDPDVGFVCTLYRAHGARRWYERLELLSLHDFTCSIVFAEMTGASDFCLGASMAFPRRALEDIGGFEPLADYLNEDYEMGRRIVAAGYRPVLVPYSVDTVVDLDSPRAWWKHQSYWDQNTRLARPKGFFLTVLVQPVPFALVFAALRLFDPLGLAVLAGTVGVRLLCAATVMARLGEHEALRSLFWLPLRDLAGLASWLAVLRARTVHWRGRDYRVVADGRMVPVEGPQTHGAVAEEGRS